MVDFLNFKKIVPPAPNDPSVDLASQINDNWDILDSGLNIYNSTGEFTPTQAGQEWLAPNYRFAVWDGANERYPDNIDLFWSAWTAIPLASGRAIRSGFTPKWRQNSLLRKVELVGGFQYDSAASTWPTSLVVLNADTGSIPATYQPTGGKHVGQCATAVNTTGVVVAAGYVIVDKPAGNTNCRIQARYMGGPGGGNFLMLDQIWWWY